MLKKLRILLLLLICVYPLKAEDKEPDFVRIFNEKFEYPKVAFRAHIELEALLKVHKTIDSFSICYDESSWYIFKNSIYKVIDSSVWTKSLPIGDYYIYIYSNPNRYLTKVIKKYDPNFIDIPNDMRYIIKNENVYFIEVEGPEARFQRIHDSLLTLYENNPEQIWNSEKKEYDYKSFISVDIDSADKVLEVADAPALFSFRRIYLIIIKSDNSIIVKKISTYQNSDTIISSRKYNSDNKSYNILFDKCLRYFKNLKSFPFFDYPSHVLDGGDYYVNVYDKGAKRTYSYSNPEYQGANWKILAHFTNLIGNYFDLFEFK